MKTIDGRLVIVSGAARCGKSTHVSQLIKSDRRVVAWDPEDQYSSLPGFRKITNKKELLKALQTPGHMKIAYVAGGDLKAEFDFLCGCIMYAGRYIAPLVYVAEELADVTTPSKAPGNWGILVRRGLKRGITIYAISQRWAEADKTAFGNASEYVLFMSRANDVPYIAKKTGLEETTLNMIKQFEYVQYDPVSKDIFKKQLRFSDKK